MFNAKIHANRVTLLLTCCLVAMLVASIPTYAQAEKLKQISLDANGTSLQSGNYPFISTDGRYVVFRSGGLLPIDTGVGQIYLYDRELDQLELVSVNDSGEPANQPVSLPLSNNAKAVSDDGRFVVFRTAADNLGAAAILARQHVYVRDRLNNTTNLVSQNDGGVIANGSSLSFAMAPNAWAVVFQSTADNLSAADDDNNDKSLYLRDLTDTNNPTTQLACFNKFGDKINQCDEPALSCHGILTFESSDSFAAADDLNPGWDVFHGLPLAGSNVTVSVSAGYDADGVSGFRTSNISCEVNSTSFRIVYATTAELSASDDDDPRDWDLYYYDQTFGESRLIRAEGNVSLRPNSVNMSTNGEWIVIETAVSLLPEDTNNHINDIYAFRFSRDNAPKMSGLRLVSQHDGVVGEGPSSHPAISDNGVVAFQSSAINFRVDTDKPSGLLDIYVHGFEEVLLDGFEE